MPALPPDPTAAGRTVSPARTRLESPLAAAVRGRVHHLRRQPPPRPRGRQVLAIVGTLLVHVFFLFGFVLGSAYQPALPPPPRNERMLQVRLIEPPEPPPPPAVRGAPPKERGPRHQGQRRPPAAARGEPGASVAARIANAPATPPSPAMATASQASAPLPPATVDTSPVASPPAPASLPLSRPAAPVPKPPALVVSIPTPLPPPFQPEPVRPPQVEGNRPILPPASLALSRVIVPAPASLPVLAIHMDMPQTVAPVTVMPAAQSAAAPDLPRPQPLPLSAQLAPTVTMPAPMSMPALIAPQVNEPQASVAPSRPPAAPATVASASTPPRPMPIVKLDLEGLTRTPAAPPRALLPASSTSIAVAQASPLAAVPGPGSAPVPPATPPAAAPANSASEIAAPDVTVDVSRAPDATPHGSDTAVVGEPTGAASATSTPAPAAPDATRPPGSGAGPTGTRGRSLAAGRRSGNQAGAMQGAPHGAIGDYVQLKPSGDTEVMHRGAPDIGYQPTRFEKDWTPENESSVDTALRRAVEKTTVRHTFHLPRGVRVECAVKPLLPIALFGCRNPDPPAVPVADKIYDPLHLAPALPLASASVASSPTSAPAAPAPMVDFDHRAECAAARLAGGPPPPDCPVDMHAVQAVRAPASSASSWAPASDQFH